MACGLTVKRSLELDPHHSPENCAKRARHGHVVPMFSSAGATTSQSSTSQFTHISVMPTSDQIKSYLRAEIDVLRRRKLLTPTKRFGTGSRSPTNDNSDSDGEASEDKPRFSLPQVQMICERLLREQEDRLREEYDRVLITKLQDQYESFTRFTQDQLHRRFNSDAPASYLS